MVRPGGAWPTPLAAARARASRRPARSKRCALLLLCAAAWACPRSLPRAACAPCLRRTQKAKHAVVAGIKESKEHLHREREGRRDSHDGPMRPGDPGGAPQHQHQHQQQQQLTQEQLQALREQQHAAKQVIPQQLQDKLQSQLHQLFKGAKGKRRPVSPPPGVSGAGGGGGVSSSGCGGGGGGVGGGEGASGGGGGDGASGGGGADLEFLASLQYGFSSDAFAQVGGVRCV